MRVKDGEGLGDGKQAEPSEHNVSGEGFADPAEGKGAERDT